MLSTERRRHDVHGLFGDVIYNVKKRALACKQ